MQRHDWTADQRQPLVSLIIGAVSVFSKVIRGLLPVLVIVLLRDGKERFISPQWVAAGIIVLTLLLSILRYLFFRFRIRDGELIINKGVMKREHLVIPLSKIQAVSITQGWLHQVLNLSKVEFDTAGSKDAEASLIIQTPLAQALKKFILQQTRPENIETAIPAPVASPVIRLSGQDLFKLALSANHLHAFVLVIVFIFRLWDDVGEAFGAGKDQLEATVTNFISNTGIGLLIGLLMAGFMLTMVYSIVRTLLNYFDFTLSRNDKGFAIKSGLINTREQLAPYGKIQYISWQANWLRSLLPLYMLRLHIAGLQHKNNAFNISIPVPRMNLVPELLPAYGQIPQEPLPVHVNRLLLVRYFITGFLITVVVAVGLYFWSRPFVYATPLILLVYVFSGWLFLKKFRLFADDAAICIRSGTFGKSVALLKWYKIQSVTLKQGWLQKRWGLGTLHLHTASGHWALPFIPLQDAQALMNYALYKVETAPQSWME